MGKRQVTVAAVQMQCTNHPQENLKKAEKMVRQAPPPVHRSFCSRNFLRENISVSRGDMIFTVMRSLWKKMKRYAGDGSWRRN